MNVESYATSRPQHGRTINEDAFLLGSTPFPHVALCDGAGAAQLAAKRVITMFGKLLSQSSAADVLMAGTWRAGTRWKGCADRHRLAVRPADKDGPVIDLCTACRVDPEATEQGGCFQADRNRP